jgi:hypothetical protein
MSPKLETKGRRSKDEVLRHEMVLRTKRMMEAAGGTELGRNKSSSVFLCGDAHVPRTLLAYILCITSTRIWGIGNLLTSTCFKTITMLVS